MNTTIESRAILQGGISPSFPMRSFLACAVLLATAAFTTAEVRLKGNVGPKVIDDDVVVTRGNTCVLNGTTITGDVRVLSGAKLVMNGAWVDGTIYAYRALSVDLRNSSRVTWNVRANRTRAILLRDGTNIGGHLRLTRGTASDGDLGLLVRNSSITGDIVAKNNKGIMLVKYNTIEGNLRFIENEIGKFVILNNEIWKDLQFFRNIGNGSIVDNTVGGRLQSRGNSPEPTIKRNDVRGNTVTE